MLNAIEVRSKQKAEINLLHQTEIGAVILPVGKVENIFQSKVLHSGAYKFRSMYTTIILEY